MDKNTLLYLTFLDQLLEKIMQRYHNINTNMY